MIKIFTPLGLLTVGLGSLIGLRVSEAGISPEVRLEATPLATAESISVGEVAVGDPKVRSIAKKVAGYSGRGLHGTPVAPELAAQLGLPLGIGLLILEVQQDTPAQEAGLEPFDVIFKVHRESVTAEEVGQVLDGEEGLSLGILRRGVEHYASLGGDLPAGGNFLSTDSLDADHAILRLAQLRDLRERLEAKTERFEEVREQLKAQARSAREEAAQAVDTLHKLGITQAREYLEERREALLARADQGLGDELSAALAALRVDLEQVLPGERVAAIDPAIKELVKSFRADLIRGAGLSEDKLQRPMAEGLGRAGQALQERMEQRVQRPWQSATRSLSHQAERLGGQHDERVAWVVATIAGIRGEVRERIDCAIKRASEDFDKQLRKRLRNMDVPAPGETAAALKDLSQQLDAWTERFIRGSAVAISTYEDRLALRQEVLVPELRSHLERSESVGAQLALTLKTVLASQLERELNFDETWRTKERVRQLLELLRTDSRGAIDLASDSMRSGALGLTRAFEDESVISEEAWDDLRATLKSLHRESGSDCWKLDGPHLDGRFPRRLSPQELKDRVGWNAPLGGSRRALAVASRVAR